ncbi:hypothetical protein [Scytonema sp. PCC 10023]|uniref:hypothetical protein n=1 Tax=Scytonema sp. PCC 10023 TaxID=1680591 RepID=UPI0039C5B486
MSYDNLLSSYTLLKLVLGETRRLRGAQCQNAIALWAVRCLRDRLCVGGHFVRSQYER